MKTCIQHENETSGGCAALVAQARSGDQQAVAALYELTYNAVYHTVKSMIKDEDAVFDILQDAYMKAFTNLERFDGGEKFEPWVRQIAANTARDWLKKKRPLLFSELSAGDDGEIPAEAFFEDEREAHLPDVSLDREETSRLIREIIGELPEDQRAAIGMFYYEELSVKEIAAAMGATENAVKSRLLYGRRKIEKKVREMEKNGTKLYGLAPVPFLLLLLRGQKAYAAEMPNAAAAQSVFGNSAAAGHAFAASPAGVGFAASAGVAAKAAGAAAGASAVKSILAVAAAVAVLGGGVFGAAKVWKGTLASKRPAAQEINIQTSPPQAVVPSAPPVAAAPAPSVPLHTDAPAPASEPPASDPLAEALEQYRAILAQADTYDFGEYADPDGTYRYALEYMESDDPVPSLLLCQNGADGIDLVRVFSYLPETNAVVAPQEALMMGVASAGGYRGALDMMGDGHGIQITEVSAMRGDTYISRAIRTHNVLQISREWSGYLDDSDPYRSTSRAITWYDLSDLNGFEMKGAAGETGAADAGESPDTLSAWAKAEQAAGRTVLSGTIDTFTYDEVVALQGKPDPNAAWADKSWTYQIIVLDAPETLRGRQDVTYRENTASMILVSSRSPSGFSVGNALPAELDGQRITFSVGDVSWPSDTGIPLGAPRAVDIRIAE